MVNTLPVNLPLLFFGLGLEENEVFRRWLLIERAYYFHRFRNRRRSAWYVYKDDAPQPGKLFFLKGVGLEPVKVDCFDDIYGPATWQLKLQCTRLHINWAKKCDWDFGGFTPKTRRLATHAS